MSQAPQAGSRRWGMPIEDWRTAVEQARAFVEDCARTGGTVTYAQLCAAVTVARLIPRSWRLMALLDEMCEEPDAEHGIVLATLVVRADTGRPGEGYFRAMERIGEDVSDREALWRRHAGRVWDAYGAPEADRRVAAR